APACSVHPPPLLLPVHPQCRVTRGPPLAPPRREARDQPAAVDQVAARLRPPVRPQWPVASRALLNLALCRAAPIQPLPIQPLVGVKARTPMARAVQTREARAGRTAGPMPAPATIRVAWPKGPWVAR